VRCRVRVDPGRPLATQPRVGHNRWHPELEPVLAVRAGEPFELETLDARDAFFASAGVEEYLRAFPAGRVHPLTGPVRVEGARPGDLLEVEVLEAHARGSGITAIRPGAAALEELLDEPCVLRWTLGPDEARCAALPGVRVPQATFPGVLGVAPSHELMCRAHAREAALARRGGAVAPQAPDDAVPPHVRDGLRTLPPREHGGNLDMRQLRPGGRVLLPVHVDGALLSAGDLHYAQGDGELGGAALEVAGAVTLRCTLHRGGRWRPRGPLVLPAPEPPRRWLQTTGLPLEADGANADRDLGLALRAAARELAAWLVELRGLPLGPACTLIGLAADVRLPQLVNAPNATVSLALPLDLFDAFHASPPTTSELLA